jgi:hypothetical protein
MGVRGLEEDRLGRGLPVSRSRMRNRCADPVGLKRTPPLVYFVSHGGEDFPQLIVVLQGDGVRVDLTGATFIDEKTNVTSSTFKAIPDVPVESFELDLPQGRFSALSANTNLCALTLGTKKRASAGLIMPTEFVAQNGVWGRPGLFAVAIWPRWRSALTRRGR